MKYITEADLRNLYRTTPFTSGDRRKIRRGMIRTVLVQMKKKTQQRRTAGKVRRDVRRI